MSVRSFATLGAVVLALGTSARAATVLDFETAGNSRTISESSRPWQRRPIRAVGRKRLRQPVRYHQLHLRLRHHPRRCHGEDRLLGGPGVAGQLHRRRAVLHRHVVVRRLFRRPDQQGQRVPGAAEHRPDLAQRARAPQHHRSQSTTGPPERSSTAPPAIGDVVQTGQFATATFTYAIDANNHPVLSVSVGSTTSTATFDTITSPLDERRAGDSRQHAERGAERLRQRHRPDPRSRARRPRVARPRRRGARRRRRSTAD